MKNTNLKKLFLYFVLLLSVTPTYSYAESTQQMLSACKSVADAKVTSGGVYLDSSYETGLCWGAFAVIQKNIIHIDASYNRIYSVCAPEESTRAQLVSIFVAYAGNSPHRLHEHFFYVALESLQKAFPC